MLVLRQQICTDVLGGLFRRVKFAPLVIYTKKGNFSLNLCQIPVCYLTGPLYIGCPKTV